MVSPNHDSNDEDSGSMIPAKRRLDESALDYPRRRATIACEVCRSRKSRCDGNRPKCKLCTELGAECVYREPGVKLDAGDKIIIEQLNRIENMLQMSMTSGSSPVGITISASPGSSNVNQSNAYNFSGRSPNGGGSNSGWGSTATAPATNISTMPKQHTIAMLLLLRWPVVRDLIPRPYDPSILLQLEMDREPLQTLSKTPAIDLSNTQAYVDSYFEKVNVWYACVNPYSWKAQYRIALSNGFREEPESCVVLLVFALGQASLRGSIAELEPNEDIPGMQYFMAAWSFLPSMMTTNTVLAAQCQLLAAAYMLYLVKPIEAWNLLCAISTKMQLLLMTPSRVTGQQRELLERIYWNTLLFESDLLAEFNLPHSGAVNFEEKVGLPGGFDGRDQDAESTDDLWYFLAEIALRRLLNRVSQLLFSRDAMPPGTGGLEPIATELDYQLTQWYEGLPGALQFPFSPTRVEDPVQAVLRLRFYACKGIIYRPFVEMAMENNTTLSDPIVRDNCYKCLEACINFMDLIDEMPYTHMAYLWMASMSLSTQTLTIMGASVCKPMQRILLQIVPMDVVNKHMLRCVMELERYAHLSPGLKITAKILREAETKRQEILRGM